MNHQFTLRVYYEDTDLAGIVYYANYLRFIERARSEWVREIGLDQRALQAQGTVFAVSRIEADYLSPARFDDVLTVETRPVEARVARLTLAQDVLRAGVFLFRAQVTLVSLNAQGRAQRLPQSLRMQARAHIPDINTEKP